MVLIGCGYVGTALARAALSRERPVHALVRSPESAETLRRIGLSTVIAADVASDDWHDGLPSGDVDVVFAVSSSGGDSVAYARTYVDGMASVLRWAAKGRVRNLIHTSSTGVYPQSAGSVVDEDSRTGGDTRSDILVETERLLLAAASKRGRISRAFVLRFGGLYGPGRHYMLDALRRGETTFAGRGDFRINYLHRDDAVDAVITVLNRPDDTPGGIFNITDGHPARKDAIAGWLAERLGKPAPVFDTSAVTARSSRRGSASPDRVVSTAKARRELGWRPAYADFREGYAAILRGAT